MRRIVAALAVALSIGVFGAGEAAKEQVSARRVLAVMSYDSRDSWSQSILAGFEEGLAAEFTADRVDLHVEYLDTRRHQGEDYLALYRQLLSKKHEKRFPELLFAADNAAFAFLRQLRAERVAPPPLIFCGVNDFKPSSLAGESGITGVNETIDIPGTVNLGLSLFPAVDRLVVLAGSSGMGALNLETFRQAQPSFSRAITVVELLDVEKADLASRLADLPASALLLRLDNLREADGSAVSLEESIKLLATHSPVPILTCWDFDLGYGALGGRVVSGKAQGRAAGDLVRQLMADRSPGDLPVLMESPNEAQFDFRQMQRFGINLSELPKGAKVVGMPLSFFDQYKRQLWTVAGVFACMAGGLLFLGSVLLAKNRAEKERRASEARYRAYVDEAPSGIFIADGTGRYLDVNPQACHLTGFSREELLSMYVHELLHPESLEDGKAHFARVKTKGAANGELRYCRKDGEIRWWSVIATAMPDATFLAHVVDVTERRRDEEARAIFRQLLDNAEHIVVFKDTGLRYVLVNRAYSALTGKTTAEVAGKTDAEVFAGLSTPEQIEVYMEADRRALSLPPGKSLTVEEGTLAQDGSVRTYLTKKFPVYGEDGRLLGSGTMTSEITEIKQGQQRLNNSIEMLGTVMDAIPADVYVMDPETYNILFMNKGMQQRFGESAIGKPCWQVLRHEAGPCVCCRLPQLLSAGDGSAVTWEEHNPVCGRIFVNVDTMITWPDGRRVKLQVASDVSELRRVEAALAESEGRFRAIFEHAAIGISQRHLDGSGAQVNPYFCKILGYSREELLSIGWVRLTHPDDHRASAIGMRRLLRGEIDFFTQEKRYLHRNGSTIWANLTLSLQRGMDGKPLSLIACLEDVTQRRHDAEARRTATDIIAQIPAGLFVYDFEPPDNLYLREANPEATRLTGIAIDDWRGREFNEIWPAAEELDLKSNFMLPFINGEPYETESVDYRDHRLAGAYRVRTFALPRQRLAVAFEDVTEQKRAEAEVAASREELRQVIDLVPHFIFAKDLEGRYLLVNRTLAEAHGLTVAEMTGRLDRDILGDRGEVARLREVDREVIASGQMRHAEVVISLPGEQEPRYYASVRVPFTVFGSNQPAVLGVSVDITEHRRDEEEKRRLTAQLHQAQKMEAIGTLAGGIAHDFNNILGAIIGYAEMLRDDSPVGSTAHCDSDQVVKAGMRAKDLVKQILAFSRQSAFERVALQPAPIVGEALKLLRASLPATIVIDQNLEADCGLVLADPTHIHQIVMNISTNAFHAMERNGGLLRVRLARWTVEEEEPSDVGRLQPGDYVRLSIEDSGDGISPEARERIFDPYFTTKEVGKGTGLGLAMVHGIVEEYGGAVVCNSMLGRGTTFHIYLPVAEDEEAQDEEPGEGGAACGEHILIVDDEQILVDLGRTMLQRAGYRVTAKTSSLEALAVFEQDPGIYDLVITDQTMPGMTGIDLARRMLQLRPGMPIILCTGYGNYLSEERIRALGIAGFAMKPLVRKEIVALIHQVLEKKMLA